MTAKQYLDVIGKLGLNKSSAGRLLRVSPRTAATYAKEGPTDMAALLLLLILQRRIPLSAVNKIET